jgi:hypothetical protein
MHWRFPAKHENPSGQLCVEQSVVQNFPLVDDAHLFPPPLCTLHSPSATHGAQIPSPAFKHSPVAASHVDPGSAAQSACVEHPTRGEHFPPVQKLPLGHVPAAPPHGRATHAPLSHACHVSAHRPCASHSGTDSHVPATHTDPLAQRRSLELQSTQRFDVGSHTLPPEHGTVSHEAAWQRPFEHVSFAPVQSVSTTHAPLVGTQLPLTQVRPSPQSACTVQTGRPTQTPPTEQNPPPGQPPCGHAGV